ncbi:MAG: hypothetical protein WAK97_22035, partial [Pseudolabrys sp.]
PVWRPFHRSVLSPNSDKNEWRCAETFGYLSGFCELIVRYKPSVDLRALICVNSRAGRLTEFAIPACSTGSNVKMIKEEGADTKDSKADP